jgi:hypothetical protein
MGSLPRPRFGYPPFKPFYEMVGVGTPILKQVAYRVPRKLGDIAEGYHANELGVVVAFRAHGDVAERQLFFRAVPHFVKERHNPIAGPFDGKLCHARDGRGAQDGFVLVRPGDFPQLAHNVVAAGAVALSRVWLGLKENWVDLHRDAPVINARLEHFGVADPRKVDVLRPPAVRPAEESRGDGEGLVQGMPKVVDDVGSEFSHFVGKDAVEPDAIRIPAHFFIELHDLLVRLTIEESALQFFESLRVFVSPIQEGLRTLKEVVGHTGHDSGGSAGVES